MSHTAHVEGLVNKYINKTLPTWVIVCETNMLITSQQQNIHGQNSYKYEIKVTSNQIFWYE